MAAPELTAGALTGPLSPGFAIYVHWPFCLSKCPYCDFNSHVRDGVDHARWRAALLAEVDRVAALLPGRIVTSIFFGGGTPSLMEPATVAAVIDQVARRLPMAADVEITLEANPTSVEAARLDGFRTAGVNRVSLGVQALDEPSLKFLGRGHSADEALAAVAIARARFPRVSFDLIYARPDQSLADWRAELGRALALGPDHLSLYQLTIEQGTAFWGAWSRGSLVMPSEDLQADLFDLTTEITTAAGLPAYEVSNHARPGVEGRHNLTYWRYGDYAGLGPGAHGRLTLGGEAHALEAERKPEAWLTAAEAGDGTALSTPLDAATRAAELLMMGLRLSEGVPLARFAASIGAPLADFVPPGRVTQLVSEGFLTLADEVLVATPAGRLMLNALLGRLLA
jgi:oxygen-independent coproporphyrinogen-3 oxidase